MNRLFIIGLIIILMNSQLEFISSNNFYQSKFYTKINKYYDYELENNSTFLLDSFVEITLSTSLKCFRSCTKNQDCYFVLFQSNKCFTCKKNFMFSMLNTNSIVSSRIYEKNIEQNDGLIHYWPFDQNYIDKITGLSLINGANASLTFDRFERLNSALSLTNGYYQVPTGIYFSGKQFSVLAWVKMKSVKIGARLIDFGNPNQNYLISISLFQQNNNNPYLFIRNVPGDINGLSTKPFELNKWQHIACVFSFPYYSFYMDGIDTTPPGSTITYQSYDINAVQRSSNFIGRSNWHDVGTDQDADADFDDLKIFNRALSQQEIQKHMN